MSKPTGFIWGPINAEDIAHVPASPWVITSGMVGAEVTQGHLYAVDVRDGSANEVFPYRVSLDLDEERFGSCPPLDLRLFEPHSLDVAARPDGVTELYVVNHTWRESVEVFEIHQDWSRPRLRWIGGVELPSPAVGNSVAAVAGGGFVVSYNVFPTAQKSLDNAPADRKTGGVFEWTPDAGWSSVAGSELNSANGIAVSPDGEWIYLAGWRSRCIAKICRGDPRVSTTSVDTPILTDNLTWTRDGSLLAAGAFDTPADHFTAGHFSSDPRLLLPSRVLRIDPETMAVDVVIEYPAGTFGAATVGLEVGDEIWVGAARDQGLARFDTGLA